MKSLAKAMRTTPAHPDVIPGLRRLLADGYRLVDSPHQPNVPSPLDDA